jgi:organic radical activating enzyme
MSSPEYKFYGTADDGSYTLYVTYKCNWYCDYCSEDTHNRGPVTIDEIKERLSCIPNGADVAITGGEPGILSKDTFEIIFDELTKKKCFINVNTNGLFFKRHADLCHIPSSFLYHCSEHLEEDEIFIPENVPREKIDFLLVVTDQTYQRLDYYINKYPDIKFLVFGADQIQYDKSRTSTGLSRKNGFEIYRKYKDRLHPDSRIHLITKCRWVNEIRNLKEIG